MKSKRALHIELRFQGRLEKIEVNDDSFIVGRSLGLLKFLDQCSSVSREHLKIEVYRNTQIWITDLGSTNGSFFEGERMKPKQAVRYFGEPLLIGGLLPDQAVEITAFLQVDEVLNPVLAESGTASIVTPVPPPFMPVSSTPVAVAKEEVKESVKEAVELSDQIQLLKLELNLLETEKARVEELVATRSKIEENLQEAVTHLENTESSLRETQGQIDAKSEVLLNLRREIEAKDLEQKQALSKADDAQRRFRLIHEEVQQEKQALEETRNEVLRLEGEKAQLDLLVAKVGEIQEEEKSVKNRIDHLSYEESSQKKTIENLKQEATRFRDQISELQTDTEKLKTEQERSQNKLVGIHEKVRDENRNLDEKRAEIARLQEEKHQLDLLLLKVKETEDLELAIKARIEALQIDQAVTVKEIEVLKQDAGRARNQILDLEVENESLLNQRMIAQAKLQATQDQVVEAQKQHDLALKNLTQELHALDVESKLKRVHIEYEVEEFRTKKMILERDFDSLSQRFETLRALYEAMDKEKTELEKTIASKKEAKTELFREIEDFTSEKMTLDLEVAKLGERIDEANQKAKNIVEEANAEAMRVMQTGQTEAAKFLEIGKDDLKKLAEVADAEIVAKKAAWGQEYETIKNLALQEYQAADRAWKKELAQQKEQDLEEVRLLRLQEEEKMREMLSKNAIAFAKSVATRALAEFSSSSTVAVSTLLTTLESRVRESLTNEASSDGTFNPHLKKDVQTFWVKFGIGAAAAVVLALGAQVMPEFVSGKLASMKANNIAQDQSFMKEVREQRERMLALHLEPKPAFQDHYVDNILYNPGYLAMKLDKKIQQEWTIRLSKFFFEELLFDDRKVVDYIPIESALVNGLADTYKVLNNQNFNANLLQMQQLEEKKTEEMWLLVGGRENWLKLRTREAEFFAQHMNPNAPAEAPRVPASSTPASK